MLFDKNDLPRDISLVRMRVADAGDGMIRFRCRACDHDTGWIEDRWTITENRRGQPCPHCNPKSGSYTSRRPKMPKRIQLQRAKGWRKPPNAVVVARPGKWGNPFAIGTGRGMEIDGAFVEEMVKDRATAVRFFADMLSYPVRPYPTDDEIRRELAGRDLACWCPPDQPCHADILLRLANEPH